MLRTGAAAGVAAALGGGGAASAFGAAPAQGAAAGRGGDIAFVNGRIHTMDDDGAVVDTVLVRDGRFAAVGSGVQAGGPRLQVINLHGRTVVPGLIESHTHFVSLANRPGHHVAQLELASTIAEVQEALAARRPDVPDGAWITSMGGFHTNQIRSVLAVVGGAVVHDSGET